MGAESKGQVGGMEGSEAIRREFASESRGWVCRECGRSNEEAMKEWWEICRERGVKIDVEGSEVVGGGKEEEDDKKQEKDEAGAEKDDGQTKAVLDEPATTPAAPASTSAVSPTPSVPSGSDSTPAVVAPAPLTQSSIRPHPTPTTPAPVAIAARTAAATQSEPANSPWLDRAIIGIIFALIILITKRTVNVDDL